MRGGFAGDYIALPCKQPSQARARGCLRSFATLLQSRKVRCRCRFEPVMPDQASRPLDGVNMNINVNLKRSLCIAMILALLAPAAISAPRNGKSTDRDAAVAEKWIAAWKS